MRRFLKSLTFLILLFVCGCGQPESMPLDYFKNQPEIVFEAGQRIILKDDFFGQNEPTDKNTRVDILVPKDSGLKRGESDLLISESGGHLPCGTYTLIARSQNEEVPFEFTVQDTVDPEILHLSDEYFLEMDHSMNLIDTLDIQDETSTRLSLYCDINTGIAGDYDCLVTAVDEAGNISEKTAVIHVLDPLFPKAKRLAYHAPEKLWAQKTITPY